MIEHWRSR